MLGRPSRSRRGAPSPARTPAPRGPADFAARLTGRTFTAARRRGKYLWLPLDTGDALLGHLGMSGQMLVQPPGAPDEGTCGSVRPWRARQARAAFRRPAHVRGAGRSVRAAPSCRPRSPTSPGTRSTRSSTRRRSSAGSAQRHPGSTAAARPDRRLGRRQHLRRRGSVAAPGCTGTSRVGFRSPTSSGCSPAAAGDGRGPGTGRDVLRRALRQRQRPDGYFDRSLEAYGREERRAGAAAPRSAG